MMREKTYRNPVPPHLLPHFPSWITWFGLGQIEQSEGRAARCGLDHRFLGGETTFVWVHDALKKGILVELDLDSRFPNLYK